jgi:hypothetical protein
LQLGRRTWYVPPLLLSVVRRRDCAPTRSAMDRSSDSLRSRRSIYFKPNELINFPIYQQDCQHDLSDKSGPYFPSRRKQCAFASATEPLSSSKPAGKVMEDIFFFHIWSHAGPIAPRLARSLARTAGNSCLTALRVATRSGLRGDRPWLSRGAQESYGNLDGSRSRR